jgi:hypothetical protein
MREIENYARKQMQAKTKDDVRPGAENTQGTYTTLLFFC